MAEQLHLLFNNKQGRAFCMSGDVIEVRMHGRGGQGVVSAANLIAEIAFQSGYMPQSFPYFGAERRGAPIIAFVRYSKESCLPRCRIYEPFCVVSFDAELPREPVLSGLKKEGILLLNGTGELLDAWLEHTESRRVFSLDASRIAVNLGLVSSGMPLVSTTMVGALARVLSLGAPDLLKDIMSRKLARHVSENIKAMYRGYNEVKEVRLDASAG